jgi:hypothetical protein
MENDGICWKTKWEVFKYASRADWQAGRAYATVCVLGNLALQEGLALLIDRLIDVASTGFGAAYARLGVGDGSTAAAATQTGLQGTNKLYKPMDASYPQRSGTTQCIWRATFTESEANFTWNEWTIANGASDSSVNLNRKVPSPSLGLKPNTEIWTLQVTLTFA